jgi:VWFA-related protein
MKIVHAAAFSLAACIALPSAAQQTANTPQFTLSTTVSRVLLDVSVTDAQGNPVHGLTQNNFAVQEDGQPQTILSFDAYNFDKGMTYTPPSHHPLPANTFLDLPSTPERGPLYVLYYDLVNISHDDQITARKQLVKFIQSKPEGARFAIFVASDDLHLIQGFTADQQKLLATVDPKENHPHLPEIFLMSVNFGEDDRLSTASRLSAIAQYLAPFPGRKNLIWFASEFPLSLFPSKNDPAIYMKEAKKTLDLLASSEIAVYPVDTSGVVINEVYAPPNDAGNGDDGAGLTHDLRDDGLPIPGISATGGGAPVSAVVSPGYSLTSASYRTQDLVAIITGGKAVYSSNDLTGALENATENGGNYYTLSYSPQNKAYDGHLRRIHVSLKDNPQYHLAYRRAYYGSALSDMKSGANDLLSAAVKHGAPEFHQVIFAAHVVPAVSLYGKRQITYTIDYVVLPQSSEAAENTAPDLKLAAAAYDADGRMLNSTVNQAVGSASPAKDRSQSPYRAQQQLDAPADAKFLRLAVYDNHSDRVGAMEIPLPLAPAS